MAVSICACIAVCGRTVGHKRVWFFWFYLNSFQTSIWSNGSQTPWWCRFTQPRNENQIVLSSEVLRFPFMTPELSTVGVRSTDTQIIVCTDTTQRSCLSPRAATRGYALCMLASLQRDIRSFDTTVLSVSSAAGLYPSVSHVDRERRLAIDR